MTYRAPSALFIALLSVFQATTTLAASADGPPTTASVAAPPTLHRTVTLEDVRSGAPQALAKMQKRWGTPTPPENTVFEHSVEGNLHLWTARSGVESATVDQHGRWTHTVNLVPVKDYKHVWGDLKQALGGDASMLGRFTSARELPVVRSEIHWGKGWTSTHHFARGSDTATFDDKYKLVGGGYELNPKSLPRAITARLVVPGLAVTVGAGPKAVTARHEIGSDGQNVYRVEYRKRGLGASWSVVRRILRLGDEFKEGVELVADPQGNILSKTPLTKAE